VPCQLNVFYTPSHSLVVSEHLANFLSISNPEKCLVDRLAQQLQTTDDTRHFAHIETRILFPLIHLQVAAVFLPNFSRAFLEAIPQ